MSDKQVKKHLKTLIDEANNIVVLTGAGFSVPSGIPDFRSAQGLFNEGGEGAIPPEEILSHSYFFQHTKLFYDFYRSKMLYLEAKPNGAHHTLAKLEACGKLKAIITQNIDGLHQEAGSQNVIELHGSVKRNTCIKCNTTYGVKKIIEKVDIPRCSCGGIIKPDVVLYEENLSLGDLEAAIEYIRECDLLIVVGTSLQVHPAASLIRYCRRGKRVIINLGETPYDKEVDLLIQAPLEEVLTLDLC